MPASQPFQPWLLEQLHNAPELALGYLNAALDENDPTTFVLALNNVVEAQRGIAVLAERSGLEPDRLIILLHGQTAPDALILSQILRGLGLRLAVAEACY